MSEELESQFEQAIRKDNAFDEKRFEPARWPGGPLICRKVNLPAFPTEQGLLDFLSGDMKKGNPLYEGVKVKRTGKCAFCGWWHAETAPRDPAGSSSGTGRSQKES